MDTPYWNIQAIGILYRDEKGEIIGAFMGIIQMDRPIKEDDTLYYHWYRSLPLLNTTGCGIAVTTMVLQGKVTQEDLKRVVLPENLYLGNHVSLNGQPLEWYYGTSINNLPET